jgi:phosphatidylserine/phosphatidylglycerophosphate/cardiolipin synthase-like enzyme
VNKWFLSPATPGSQDSWCFQTVPTNEIRLYFGDSYLDYYARLAKLIGFAQFGDEIFLTGWGFDLSTKLDGKQDALSLLAGAKRRGVTVRLLSNPDVANNQNVKQMQEAKGKNIDARIDWQLTPGTGENRHQKAAYISTRSGGAGPVDISESLFVGGMDIADRRLWLDVQAEVMGLGARLGRLTLEERWESVVKPKAGNPFPRDLLPDPRENKENHRVQFVRTYSPFPADQKGWERTYAPAGDHTYYTLVCQAIGLAQKSIYLEDQFLFPLVKPPKPNRPADGPRTKKRSDLPDVPDTLERLLAEAIGRGVKVVVVGPTWGPQWGNEGRTFEGNRKLAVKTLRAVKKKSYLLRLTSAPFVHSKAWIFDDEFVVVGSANFSAESFVSVSFPAASEFGVAFTSKIDGTKLDFPGVSFARALRIKLWERLRKSMDPAYTFPREVEHSFDDEVVELLRPFNGKPAPFAEMD